MGQGGLRDHRDENSSTDSICIDSFKTSSVQYIHDVTLSRILNNIIVRIFFNSSERKY